MTEAVELLRELATKLGTTVELLWPHAVRYIVVDALSPIIVTLLAVLVISIIFYKVKDLSWTLGDDYCPSIKLVVAIILGVSFLVLCINLERELPRIFEPTGYLVHRIIR